MVSVADPEAAVRAVESYVRANPVVAAAVVAAVLVLLAAAYYAYRFEWPRGVHFQRAMADCEEVAFLMHPNPDPDAMACAVALASLAEQEGVDATVQFPGQIRHQENRAFRTVLDLDLECIDHVSELAAEAVVLVDHNEPRGFAGAEDVLPYAVVDHHPGGGTGEVFTDVRTDYGACASIVVDYFRDLGAEPVAPDQHESEVDAEYVVPSDVATGLLYGILSDTSHLTQGCAPADFEASAWLSPAVDEDLLDRIANPQVSAEVLDVKARAITDHEVRGSFAVAEVGELSNVDAIPQAADELVQLEGVTAVVVVGERDGVVHLSGRSRDDRVHMGQVLETAVEDVPGGSAGGHARMGGGNVPVEKRAMADGYGDGTGDGSGDLVERLFASLTGDV